MIQTLYYRSWTDEMLTVDPGDPASVVVINPLGGMTGQPSMITVTPLRQVIKIAETTGGGVFAKSISDMMNTVKQNQHKPMLFVLSIG